MLIEPAPEREDTMDEQQRTGGREESDGATRRTASGVAGGVRRAAQPSQDDAARDDAERETPAAAPGSERGAATAGPEPVPATPPEVEMPPAETPDAGDAVTLDHVLLETNIDDMSPELLAHAADALREAGAVDVWMSPATMKKGRPGVVLHVLAESAERQRLADVLFGETSTFGVRVLPVGRIYADERRESVTIGKLRVGVRLGFVGGRLVTVSPEYEDVRRVAAAVGRPAKVVYEAVQAAARTRFSGA
jgi:hypothetical protein